MGACFRGKESLVLSLPGFIWKKISNERVKWALDYSSVDAAEVRITPKLWRLYCRCIFKHRYTVRMYSTALFGIPLLFLQQLLGVPDLPR